MMIAAGVNAKALSTYPGHANISITFNGHGHLMPSSEAEARDPAQRLAQCLIRTHPRTHGSPERRITSGFQAQRLIFYVEFDGRRRKRLVIKVLGE